MLFQDRHEEVSHFLVALLEDILMIEPDTFLIVELGTSLAATREVEQLDQFVHRHHLLVVARIPSQQSQEVDHSLWQIALFTVAAGHLTALRIMPLQWEHRET